MLLLDDNIFKPVRFREMGSKMIKETLIEFGLTDKEAEIYIKLLEERSCTASRISKLSKMNRTTAYLELGNLMKKGLVSYIIKDSKRYYQAASPGKFLEILNTKKAKIKEILPSLKDLHKSIEPFKFEVFEGKEGIKTFYQDILNNAGEVLAFGVTGNAFEILKYDFPHFVKKYEKAGIKARYLANGSAKELLKQLPKSGVKIKYLPEKYYSDITTIIYKNKVAIQSLIKDNLFVVVISDKMLYEGYRNYFEFMWKLI